MDSFLQWLYSSSLLIVGFVLAIFAIAHMLTQRRSPQSALAWLLIIILLPWVGVPLYLMFSGRKMPTLVRSKSALQLSGDHPQAQDALGIDKILQSYGLPGACEGHDFQFNGTGEASYQALMDLIRDAKTSIDYTTFILGHDAVGHAVVAALAEKAAAGVEVRLLLDGAGCLKMSSNLTKPLSDAGGQVVIFDPVWRHPFRGWSNLRNHRKMVIADGRRVWSGGCNTAQEYIGPSPMPQSWQDFTFTIEGPVVRGFSEIFASDWAFATKTDYHPVRDAATLVEDGTMLQVVPSGPDVAKDPLFASLMNGFFRAQKNIRIVTPYFVPPDEATHALTLASRRGVDVAILIPKVSNHRLADWARAAHLRELQEAGAKVFLYPDGMVHAKGIVIDDVFASIGSANFDDRSFFLNYEIMVNLYGEETIRDISGWIDSRTLKAELGVAKAGRARLILEGVARLSSPLL